MKELNKSKKSKKKLFVTLGLLFGLAGIGTAAFAGYVIGEQNKEDSLTNTPGNITISDQSVSVKGTIEENDTLKFYPASKVEGQRVNYDGDPQRDLELGLKVTITGGETGLASLIGQNIKVSIADGGTGQAITDGFITASTVSDTPIVAEKTEYEIPLTFGFGEKFNEKDPCEYFNNDEEGKLIELGNAEDTSTEGNTVWGILKDFSETLQATTITISISIAA